MTRASLERARAHSRTRSQRDGFFSFVLFPIDRDSNGRENSRATFADSIDRARRDVAIRR